METGSGWEPKESPAGSGRVMESGFRHPLVVLQRSTRDTRNQQVNCKSTVPWTSCICPVTAQRESSKGKAFNADEAHKGFGPLVFTHVPWPSSFHTREPFCQSRPSPLPFFQNDMKIKYVKRGDLDC